MEIVAGEIALLVANPTPSVLHYKISEPDNKKHAWIILQVNDKSDRLQLVPLEGEVVTIENESVQLLTTSK